MQSARWINDRNNDHFLTNLIILVTPHSDPFKILTSQSSIDVRNSPQKIKIAQYYCITLKIC
jgi:hypothetical protein